MNGENGGKEVLENMVGATYGEQVGERREHFFFWVGSWGGGGGRVKIL